MTQREILARATLITKIKKIRLELDLPRDPYMDRALYRAQLSDMEGIYQGLKKMQSVQLRTAAVSA